MMLNIGNTFSRPGYVLIHFCRGEDRHLFKRHTPSISGILGRWFVTSITMWGIHNNRCSSDSNSLLFSLGVQTIWTGIYNIFVLSSLDVLFYPDKDIRWLLNLNKSYKWLVECKITKQSLSYLFRSSALVLRPLPGSPLHFNQNLSSLIFNSDGFRRQSDTLGISCSSRNDMLDIFHAR